MTTLLYAMGTGLGHLVRARAFAHGHGLPLHVLTTNPRAPEVLRDLPHTVVHDAVRHDGPALRELVELMVAELHPGRVILDVFPNGIRNELVGWTPPGGAVSLLVRRLRQAPVAGGPPIHTAWLCEPVETWHRAWLADRAQSLRPATLVDPPAALPEGVRQLLNSLPRPLWAVVHSGPRSEVQLLLDHARDEAFALGLQPSLLLIHPRLRRLAGVHCVQLMPAWPVFPLVDRVVGGAGFNLVRQCVAVGVDFLPIPLPRRFDDQAGRARAARRQLTADRSAPAPPNAAR